MVSTVPNSCRRNRSCNQYYQERIMREPVKQDGIDLNLRRTYIGTSEWATTAGLFNKYKTPYQIWDEKVNGYTPFDNLRMRLGRDIEPMIAGWVEEDMDVHVARDGKVRFHPEYDFLATNLDGVIYHKDGQNPSVFEIKTASTIARDTWGAELPIQYYTQIQGQMLISGLKKAYVAILTFGFAGPEKFEIQEYDFNPKYIQTVVTQLVSFWNGHVIPKIAPEPVTNEDLKLIFPESNGDVMLVDDDVLASFDVLSQLKETKKEVTQSIKNIEINIKKSMGNHEFLSDGDRTLATWKTGSPRSTFNSKLFREDHPSLYDEYLKQSDPIRTFRVK
jgi:putative phage-type endonuclease